MKRNSLENLGPKFSVFLCFGIKFEITVIFGIPKNNPNINPKIPVNFDIFLPQKGTKFQTFGQVLTEIFFLLILGILKLTTS